MMKNKHYARESYSLSLARYLRDLCRRTGSSPGLLAAELGRRPDFIERLEDGSEGFEFSEFVEVSKLMGLDPVDTVREFQHQLSVDDTL